MLVVKTRGSEQRFRESQRCRKRGQHKQAEGSLFTEKAVKVQD